MIIQVRSGPKVLKSWYGLTLDGSMTISDLYFKIKDGEIDPENPIADLAGVETVTVYGGKSKSCIDIQLDKNLLIEYFFIFC